VKLQWHLGGTRAGRTPAAWALSFEPSSDDVREATSHALIGHLHAAKATVRAYDPEAMHNMRRRYSGRRRLRPVGPVRAR